jgi:hypothetical protein
MENPYKTIGISKLSQAQILKLIKGKGNVLCKYGNDHEIHVSHDQHKKLMSAIKKGKGCMIKMDPIQSEMHMNGTGFMDTLKHIVHKATPVMNHIGKKALPIIEKVAIKMATKAIEQQLVGGSLSGGEIKKKGGRPRKNGGALTVAGGSLSGEGVKDDVIKTLKYIGKKAEPIAINIGTKMLERQLLGGSLSGGSLNGGSLTGTGKRGGKMKGSKIGEKLIDGLIQIAPALISAI